MSSAAAAANRVDTVVIGAGVVGLAVARALSRLREAGAGCSDILLVERANRIGSETSSRNSEVIHAGLYYPQHSLKAQFCVKGNQQLYEYCSSRNIPHRKCGKLVIATESHQHAALAQLQKQAEQNGVHDTKLLSVEETVEKEPYLAEAVFQNQLHGALWSPSTGIVDSHSLMLCLLADAESTATTTLALNSLVEDARLVKTTNQPSQSSSSSIEIQVEGMWLSCRTLINCAGLWAPSIANLFHRSRNNDNDNTRTPSWQPPRHYFARGTYFRAQGGTGNVPKFSHLIYPVPDPGGGGLGVHATLDLQGQIKFGPDVEWLDAAVENPDDIDLRPDPHRAESFYGPVRSYWPDLPDGALVPDYVGIRPKLVHPSLYDNADPSRQKTTRRKSSVPFSDYLIAGPETHGVPGLVHLFGIESPGLTSSMAIADYVAKLAAVER